MQKKIMIIIVLFNIISLIIFQWYLIFKFQTGFETDSYIASLVVPQIIISIINSTLPFVLIPILADLDSNKIQDYICSIIFGFLFLSFFVTLMLYFNINNLVLYSFPGFDYIKTKLTIELIKPQLIGININIINIIIISYLSFKEKFIKIESSNLLVNFLALVLLILFLPIYNIILVPWLILLKNIILLLILIYHTKLSILFIVNFKYVYNFYYKYINVFNGSLILKSEPFVDRFILSSDITGNLSTYYYCQQIYGIISTILSKAFIAPCLTKFSILFKQKKILRINNIYKNSLSILSILSITSILFILFFGDYIVDTISLLTNSKLAFNTFSPILFLMSGYLIFGVLGELSSSLLFALRKSYILIKLSIITFFIFNTLKFFIYFEYGILGMALLSSAYLFINFAIQNNIILNKK